VAGFVVLAASSFALVFAFPSQSLWPLIPGFLLQGVGLGIVLTVNDPTALGYMPAEDQGQASGISDTGEQLGGALGIALYTVVLMHVYYGRLYASLAERGIKASPREIEQGREFVLRAEQKGIKNVKVPPDMREVLSDFEAAHVYAFQLTFALMGVVAIVGAVACWLLVRKTDREAPTRIFARRSRWMLAATGKGSGSTHEQGRPSTEKPT
jgi:MFS family permease